jgi:predicted acyltransferase (DUF342 family)
VEIGGEVFAKNIEVGGTLKPRKAIAEGRVEVGGSIRTIEGATAHFVEIGKRGEARGPIKADQVDIGKGASVENIFGKQVLMRNGADAESIYGESITIEPNCRISGEIQYTKELRIGDNVSLSKTPQRVSQIAF